jgi:hypothetical protein
MILNLTRELPDDRFGLIGRTIINYDHLRRRAGLVENRFDRGANQRGAIVSRNHDADWDRHTVILLEGVTRLKVKSFAISPI